MSAARSIDIRRLLREYSIVAIFATVFIGLSIASPDFLTFDNLRNVLQQVSLIGIIAMGMTLLLITANFDLSVGGQVAFIGIVAVKLSDAEGVLVGVAAALALGIACGVLNGFFVWTMRVNSLIATLGSGLLFSGSAFLLAGSSPPTLEDRWLADFANSTVFGLPTAGVIFVLVALVAGLVLHGTVGGREIFAVGANRDAARYSGARIGRVHYAAFGFIGLLCAISSLLLVGLLNAGLPDAAETYPLDVIAAVVLGGVSIAGGKGSIPLAVIGVLLIGTLNNGFNLLDLDPNLYRIMTGLIIIGAVAFDSFVQSRGSVPPGGAAAASSNPTPDLTAPQLVRPPVADRH